ncbi:MAG: hypothetical protein J5617_03985 [Bacilli bacterium]|nr:hypothetical protein [Bacilli bacterium]
MNVSALRFFFGLLKSQAAELVLISNNLVALLLFNNEATISAILENPDVFSELIKSNPVSASTSRLNSYTVSISAYLNSKIVTMLFIRIAGETSIISYIVQSSGEYSISSYTYILLKIRSVLTEEIICLIRYRSDGEAY